MRRLILSVLVLSCAASAQAMEWAGEYAGTTVSQNGQECAQVLKITQSGETITFGRLKSDCRYHPNTSNPTYAILEDELFDISTEDLVGYIDDDLVKWSFDYLWQDRYEFRVKFSLRKVSRNKYELFYSVGGVDATNPLRSLAGRFRKVN